MMDPLSIAASVGSLTCTCLSLAKLIGNICTKYNGAPQLIISLQTETKVIGISLSQLQRVLLSDADSLPSQALLDSEIISVIDVALTGCSVTLSCLEEEIHGLVERLGRGFSVANKAGVVWKDDKFKDMLHQLRGQCSALNLLLSSLQMKSLTDIHRLLKENQNVLRESAHSTESLRALYSLRDGAESFLGSMQANEKDSIFGDIDAASVTQKVFAFDHQVMNSPVYRRALVAKEGKGKHVPKNFRGEEDLIDLGADVSEAVGNHAGEERKRSPRDLDILITPIDEPKDAQPHPNKESRSNYPHTFERWETLSAHWEGLTNFWIRRLEANAVLIDSQPFTATLTQQVADLSGAGKNLFDAVVELQRMRASSERKFQRWFFETRAELERTNEIQVMLEDALEKERVNKRLAIDDAVKAEKEVSDEFRRRFEIAENQYNLIAKDLDDAVDKRAELEDHLIIANDNTELTVKKWEIEKNESTQLLESRKAITEDFKKISVDLQDEKDKSAKLQGKLRGVLASLQGLAEPTATIQEDSTQKVQKLERVTPELPATNPGKGSPDTTIELGGGVAVHFESPESHVTWSGLSLDQSPGDGAEAAAERRRKRRLARNMRRHPGGSGTLDFS